MGGGNPKMGTGSPKQGGDGPKIGTGGLKRRGRAPEQDGGPQKAPPPTPLPPQFAEIMQKIEEYISRQPKAAEGSGTFLLHFSLFQSLFALFFLGLVVHSIFSPFSPFLIKFSLFCPPSSPFWPDSGPLLPALAHFSPFSPQFWGRWRQPRSTG